MQLELNKLIAECKRVERLYINKRNNKKTIESTLDNANLVKEFLNKGANDLLKFANKILEEQKDDNVELKSEFEKILKKYATDISKKIISG